MAEIELLEWQIELQKELDEAELAAALYHPGSKQHRAAKAKRLDILFAMLEMQETKQPPIKILLAP